MRSIIRREKTSIVATLSCRSSMIVGETYAALAERKSCSLSEPMPQCSRAYFSNSEVMSISFSVKKRTLQTSSLQSPKIGIFSQSSEPFCECSHHSAVLSLFFRPGKRAETALSPGIPPPKARLRQPVSGRGRDRRLRAKAPAPAWRNRRRRRTSPSP